YVDFDLPHKGDEQTVHFTINPTGGTDSGTFSLEIQTGGRLYNRGTRLIAYDHIPVQTIFPLAEAKVERIDLKTEGKRIGYINGAGDLIPEALSQVGYQVTNLPDARL